jgi:hypothetical protein
LWDGYEVFKDPALGLRGEDGVVLYKHRGCCAKKVQAAQLFLVKMGWRGFGMGEFFFWRGIFGVGALRSATQFHRIRVASDPAKSGYVGGLFSGICSRCEMGWGGNLDVIDAKVSFKGFATLEYVMQFGERGGNSSAQRFHWRLFRPLFLHDDLVKAVHAASLSFKVPSLLPSERLIRSST